MMENSVDPVQKRKTFDAIRNGMLIFNTKSHFDEATHSSRVKDEVSVQSELITCDIMPPGKLNCVDHTFVHTLVHKTIRKL